MPHAARATIHVLPYHKKAKACLGEISWWLEGALGVSVWGGIRFV